MNFTTFAERLLRVEFYPAQRVCFQVIYDCVEPCDLTGSERDLARQLFGDVETVPPAARKAAGGLQGRAELAGRASRPLRCCHLAATCPAPRLGPSEALYILGVGPDLRLARQWLDFSLGEMRSQPDLAARVSDETRDSFAFHRDDGRVVIFSAMPATAGGSAVRGRTLLAATMTEASFFRDQNSVINDADIYKALAPRVVPGGQLIIESTPWTEAGLVWSLFQQNFG